MYDPAPKFRTKVQSKYRPKVVVPSYIGESGQVANWLFYNGAGDKLFDFSGENNHATIYEGRWRDGPHGWGLYLDGDGQGAAREPFTNDRGTEMTALAWLKPAADLTGNRVISKWGVDHSWLLSVGDNTANEPRWVIYHAGNFHILDAGEDVTVDSWNFLAATIDTPSDEMRFYLDGSESPDSPLSEAMGAPDDTTNDVVVGAQKDSDAAGDLASAMVGTLAWCVLYVGRVFSAGEVSEFFERTRGIFGA